MELAVDSAGNLYVACAPGGSSGSVVKVDFGDATAINFSSIPYGTDSTSTEQTATLENIGNMPLVLTIPQSGNNPAVSGGFSFALRMNMACPVLTSSSTEPVILGGGESCLLPLTFSAGQIGSLTGSLTLTDNNLNAPGASATQTFQLMATVVKASAKSNS